MKKATVKKRLLSIALCLCLICCTLPLGVMAEHSCIDEDTDYWCDECYEILPHICKDFDKDYCCDYCYGPVGHTCIDEDGDYWCDLCDNLIEHTCVDEDEDAWCDLCDCWIEHDCIDEDGDYWCDRCDYPMEHDCIDEDGDDECDICYLPLTHDCFDSDGDDFCDVCGQYTAGFFVPVTVTVTSYLDEDVAGSLVFTTPFSGMGDEFLGNHYSDTWDFLPGSYTWTASKDGHVTRTGTLTVGEEAAELSILLCPIGDVSQDGKVNVADTSKIYAHVRGTGELTDYAFACGDVNGDGKLNVADTSQVYAHVKQTNPLW